MSAFVAITDEQLRDELTRAAGDPTAANTLFGRFLYVQELVGGNFCSAFDHGMQLLYRCQNLAPDAYAKIHKGTPFYWLGTAAFQKHDYEIAVFFFDAAVSEDLRINAHPVHNSTPSIRFILVEGDQPEQAAQLLVQETETRLKQAIVMYNELPDRPPGAAPLQMLEIRNRFLKRAVLPGGEGLRTLATALISFCLEWSYMTALIKLRPAEGTTEPFFLHLFKGCLLFESLLKANPRKSLSNAETLGRALQMVSDELGTPHNISIAGSDFTAILASLPESSDSVASAVEYTGRIRNTVGHHLGWKAPLDSGAYDALATKVACACLHAIACLYR